MIVTIRYSAINHKSHAFLYPIRGRSREGIGAELEYYVGVLCNARWI